MTMRINTALASAALATLFTLGASSQASAFDLLEELIGGTKYADAGGCGCSQKSGGHVQRCGSDCGSQGLKGPAQRYGGKGFAGHVQHSGSKGGSCGGHVQRSGGKGGSCGGHVQRSGSKGGSCGGHAQHSGSKGGSCGGHAQRSIAKSGHVQRGGKGGTKGGSSKIASHHAALCAKMKAKMASMKCMLSSHHSKCGSASGKGNSKDLNFDVKAGGYDDSLIVPAPVISEGIQSVPVPPNPDHST